MKMRRGRDTGTWRDVTWLNVASSSATRHCSVLVPEAARCATLAAYTTTVNTSCPASFSVTVTAVVYITNLQ